MKLPTYLETTRLAAEWPRMDRLVVGADLGFRHEKEIMRAERSHALDRSEVFVSTETRDPGKRRLSCGTTLRIES